MDDDHLQLVGPFCNWTLETEGLLFDRVVDTSGVLWQEHRLCVRLDCGSIEFQVVSNRQRWNWRAFPKSKRYGIVFKTGTPAAARSEAVVGGADDGHNHNFQIKESPPKVVVISVWLQGVATQEAPSLNALLRQKNVKVRVTYSYEILDPQVALLESKVMQLTQSAPDDSGTIADHATDHSPLRLAGPFCQWKLHVKGLELKRGQDQENGAWQKHHLCARLHTGEIHFQIVSSTYGYRWRLFPKSMKGSLLKTGTPAEYSDVVLGGSDDGEHHNFRISEEPFTVVTISVWLQSRETKNSMVEIQPGMHLRAFVTYSCENIGLQVAVLANSVQYPPKAIDFLRPEILKQATPELLEQRLAFIKKVCWQLQKEYADHKVQEEVLALMAMFLEGVFLAPVCNIYTHSFTYYPLRREAAERQNKTVGLLFAGFADPVESYFRKWRQTLAQSHRRNLRELWSTLTSDKGPLMQETWVASGCRKFARCGLPAGGLFASGGGSSSKANISEGLLHSPMELWSFLCRCGGAAKYAAGTIDFFCPSGCLQDVEDDRICQDNMSEAANLLTSMLSGLPEITEQRRAQWKFQALLGLCIVNIAAATAMAENATNEAEVTAANSCKDTYQEAKKLLTKCLQGDHCQSPVWLARIAFLAEAGLCGTAARTVQNLPAVQAARMRALKAVGLPQTTGDFQRVDMAAQEASGRDAFVLECCQLFQRRLRLVLHPLPSVIACAANSLQEHRICSGSAMEYLGGQECTAIEEAFSHLHDEIGTFITRSCQQTKNKSPKAVAGRVARLSLKQLFAHGLAVLADPTRSVTHMMAVHARDTLQSILADMGSAGKGMRVEPTVLFSNFQQHEQMLSSQGEHAGQDAKFAFTVVLSGKGTSTLRFHSIADDDDPLPHAKDVLTLRTEPFSWVCYSPQHYTQEVMTIQEQQGVYFVTAFATPVVVVPQAKPKQQTRTAIHEYSQADACQSCQDFAGAGLVVPCPQSHRLCQNCFNGELRKEPVPTCPACAKDKDGRIASMSTWDCLSSSAIKSAGCICAMKCIDPGARVVILEHRTKNGLTGKFAEALWWDIENSAWEVRICATGDLYRIPAASLRLATTCPPKSPIDSCPCWPAGRGIWPVSLGNRCIVKMGIDKCSGPADDAVGYPYFHGADYQPFDSLVTRLEAILFFLRHDFRGFHATRDTTKVEVSEFSSRLNFDVHRSPIHSFPHHDPDVDRGKFERRIQRFRLLCKHSRDAPGARTLLFIRFLGDSREIGLMDETYAAVRLRAGGQARLIFICMLQNEAHPGKMYRHERFPRVFIYLLGEVKLIDYRPIGQACRFAVLDEAGLLGNVPTISIRELQKCARPFSDPYTQGWMLPLEGQDPAFFQDGFTKSQTTQALLQAAQAGDLQAVSASFANDVDVNAWDEAGRTALHYVAVAESQGESTAQTLDCVANLLLAHADPGCHDRSRCTVVDFAQNMSASLPVQALLCAAAAVDPKGAHVEVASAGSGALHAALDALGEPRRSQLCRILGIDALCVVRKCPRIEFLLLRSSMTIAHLRHDLRRLERFTSGHRKAALNDLLRRWHPDRNHLRPKQAVDALRIILAKRSELLRC